MTAQQPAGQHRQKRQSKSSSSEQRPQQQGNYITSSTFESRRTRITRTSPASTITSDSPIRSERAAQRYNIQDTDNTGTPIRSASATRRNNNRSADLPIRSEKAARRNDHGYTSDTGPPTRSERATRRTDAGTDLPFFSPFHLPKPQKWGGRRTLRNARTKHTNHLNTNISTLARGSN